MRRGKLLVWEDDKGRGLIQSDKGGEDILLPISALRKGYRRPRVGDTILYSLKLEVDGSLSAHDAAIEGVAPQRASTKSRNKTQERIKLFVGCGAAVLVALVFSHFWFNRSNEAESPDAATPTLNRSDN